MPGVLAVLVVVLVVLSLSGSVLVPLLGGSVYGLIVFILSLFYLKIGFKLNKEE